MEITNFYFLITCFIIIPIKQTLAALTASPDNYLARDSYYLNDITNTNEQYRYIEFAYLMSSSSTISAGNPGYLDEYSGVYYAPMNVKLS
jgi:hypothetical protein